MVINVLYQWCRQLAVQWQMLGELRHDNAGQQSRGGVTAPDGFRWQWCLHDTVAPVAGQLRADCFYDSEHSVGDIQLFREAFSQRFQFAAADRAFGFCRGITCLSRGRGAICPGGFIK
jgi:hypothetical protein